MPEPQPDLRGTLIESDLQCSHELDLANELKKATGLSVTIYVASHAEDGVWHRRTELWCFNPRPNGVHHDHTFKLSDKQRHEVIGFVRGFIAGLEVEL